MITEIIVGGIASAGTAIVASISFAEHRSKKTTDTLKSLKKEIHDDVKLMILSSQLEMEKKFNQTSTDVSNKFSDIMQRVSRIEGKGG